MWSDFKDKVLCRLVIKLSSHEQSHYENLSMQYTEIFFHKKTLKISLEKILFF